MLCELMSLVCYFCGLVYLVGYALCLGVIGMLLFLRLGVFGGLCSVSWCHWYVIFCDLVYLVGYALCLGIIGMLFSVVWCIW